MKVYKLLSELSSENRLGVLQALDTAPTTFTNLTKAVGMNSTETSRQLSRLMEAQLIEKKGDGKYYNTLFGKLVISSMSDLTFISENSAYFLNHDTTHIPLHLLRQIDALSKGEFATGVYNILSIFEKLGPDITTFACFMSDDFPRHHLSGIENILDEGMEIRAILPKDLVTTVTFSTGVLQKMKIKTMDQVNISVVTTDSFSMLQLPGPDGKVDQDTAIFGSDDRFRDWCKELFRYQWEQANVVFEAL